MPQAKKLAMAKPSAPTTHHRPRRRGSWHFYVYALAIAAIGIWLGQYYNREHLGDDVAVTTTTNVISSVKQTCSCDTSPNNVGLFPATQNVTDCCCSFADMEQANNDHVHHLLQRIVATPFFGHFKIDLDKECQLWDDNSMCMLRDCSVCECEEPPVWAANVDLLCPDENDVDSDESSEWPDDALVTTIHDSIAVPPWESSPVSSFSDHSSTDIDQDTAVVVDLRLNPERFTGYDGPSAHRVWSAVYNDNCFPKNNNIDTISTPERVYNNVLSGMHASISLHIAHTYCFPEARGSDGTCQQWDLHTALANERVLHHPERVEHLYVAFGLLLRAIQKAGDAVTAAVPVAEMDDVYQSSYEEWKQVLWPALQDMATSCPIPLDESNFNIVQSSSASSTKQMILRRLQELQRIMQCVGCDRCKLWGTLQTLGVSTAWRILLHNGDDDDGPVRLSRQEAVALVHTLERFSSSLLFAREFLDDPSV